jgi:hypothetical protein
MEFLKSIYAKIFGEKTDLSITATKGFRGTLALIGTLIISNMDSVSSAILKFIPDSIEQISISGVCAEQITVYSVVIFVLMGVANLLKQMPFTKDNKLVRTITG